MNLEKLTESQKSTEVYHQIGKCATIFSRLSSGMPKQLLLVVQKVHSSLDDALEYVFRSGNEYPKEEKLKHLHLAQDSLFYQFNRIEYLVKSKGITIGQANEFLVELREAHTQVLKWINSLRQKS